MSPMPKPRQPLSHLINCWHTIWTYGVSDLPISLRSRLVLWERWRHGSRPPLLEIANHPEPALPLPQIDKEGRNHNLFFPLAKIFWEVPQLNTGSKPTWNFRNYCDLRHQYDHHKKTHFAKWCKSLKLSTCYTKTIFKRTKYNRLAYQWTLNTSLPDKTCLLAQ